MVTWEIPCVRVWVRRSGSLLGAGVAAVLALASACSSDTPSAAARLAKKSEGCLLNSDCNDPLVCAYRRCHDACTTSRDCPEGQRCLASDRPFHVCQLDDETECTYHSDCPPSLVCGSDGECRDQCTTSRDCLPPDEDEDAPGQVCIEGTCADPEELDDEGNLPEVDEPSGGATDGKTCAYSSDCTAPEICLGGVCRAECKETRDCAAGAECVDGACVVTPPPVPVDPNAPDHCSDGMTDGDELDVDCGGSCIPCAPGAACDAPEDCTSLSCLDGVCQRPTCSDGARNGTETDVDCGGPSCDPCPALPECDATSDCDDGEVCKIGVCRADTCANGAVDPGETAADCGGPDCAPCDHGLGCSIDGDCVGLRCDRARCATPTCADTVQNGTETGRDCGGSCGLCANGIGCAADSDCASDRCDAGTCAAPACDDKILNGDESALDCGGVDCDGCATGEDCRLDVDCASALCIGGSCSESFTLTVDKTGTGTGTVTSTDSRVQCGTTCDVEYVGGSSVTLRAAPTSDSTFGGWSGACTGTSDCVLAIDDDETVTATFTLKDAADGWAVSLAGDSPNPYPTGIATDASGNAYAAGLFCSETPFNGGVRSSSSCDGYLVTYDASGSFVRARTFGSTGDQVADAVVSNGAGELFVSGWGNVSGATSFGGGSLNCSANSLMVAKIRASDGASLGSTCVGTGVYSHAYFEGEPSQNLAVKSNGNAVVGGAFAGVDVDFGGFVIGSTYGYYAWAVVEVAASDLSVVRVAEFGTDFVNNELWAVASNGIDANVAVGGRCPAVINFGSAPGERAPFGEYDACIAKLNDALVPIWARHFGGSGPDHVRGLAVAPNGDVIAVGSFESNIEFGTGVAPGGSSGGREGFVVRLAASDGAPIWSRAIGGADDDSVGAVAVDPVSGRIAIMGMMGSAIDLGGGALPYTTGDNLFVAVFDANGNHVDSRASGAESVSGSYPSAAAITSNPVTGWSFTGRLDGIGALPYGFTGATIGFAHIGSTQ